MKSKRTIAKTRRNNEITIRNPTKPNKEQVHVTAWSRTPSSSGFLNSVMISRDRDFEEFIINDRDGSVTSLGSYQNPSRGPDPLIFLDFKNFEPNYVYQLLLSQFHDHVLSEHIADQIVQAKRDKKSKI
ncbi:hypothetical protein AtNW77_Chr2g0243141 [Arabidopsis thaliana]|uniref:Uncharacterized protein n=2 Tax=Arabidopsis TaxID=3701 RepID=A0A178VZF7_ARATH|nr:hypothetical protein AXX17_AT2G19950 [Arabidopsis thaliana]CAA0370750.1 unnamed protein product [Arabidopsis thaliana]